MRVHVVGGSFEQSARRGLSLVQMAGRAEVEVSQCVAQFRGTGIGIERVFIFLDGVGDVFGLTGIDRFFLINVGQRGVEIGLCATGRLRDRVFAEFGRSGLRCAGRSSLGWCGLSGCRKRRRQQGTCGGEGEPGRWQQMLCSHHPEEFHTFRAGLDRSIITRNTNWMRRRMGRADLSTVKDDFTRDWSQRSAGVGRFGDYERFGDPGKTPGASFCGCSQHRTTCRPDQCRKWRMPVKTMAMPRLSAAAITS